MEAREQLTCTRCQTRTAHRWTTHTHTHTLVPRLIITNSNSDKYCILYEGSFTLILSVAFLSLTHPHTNTLHTRKPILTHSHTSTHTHRSTFSIVAPKILQTGTLEWQEFTKVALRNTRQVWSDDIEWRTIDHTSYSLFYYTHILQLWFNFFFCVPISLSYPSFSYSILLVVSFFWNHFARAGVLYIYIFGAITNSSLCITEELLLKRRQKLGDELLFQGGCTKCGHFWGTFPFFFHFISPQFSWRAVSLNESYITGSYLDSGLKALIQLQTYPAHTDRLPRLEDTTTSTRGGHSVCIIPLSHFLLIYRCYRCFWLRGERVLQTSTK